MKKILLLLLTTLFFVTAVFAEEEEQDINYYLELFSSGDFADVDLVETFGSETLEDFNDASLQEQITEAMEEAGLDDTTINNTKKLMTNIGDAADDGDTEISINDVIVGENFTLDDLTDGIVVLIADQVRDQIFSGDQEEEMKETFKTVANGLNMLSEFGQANAQSSTSSSLFGNQGYKLFALTFGTSLSVAADSDTMSSVSSLLNNDDGIVTALEEKLEEGGFGAGFAMQGFTANVGINLGFLVDNLYAGAVFGTTSVNVTSDNGLSSKILGIPVYSDDSVDLGVEGVDLSLQTSTFGLTANYQLFEPKGIPILVRWNGLSLGTGFIVNTFNIGAEIENLTVLFDDDDSETSNDSAFGANFSVNSTSFTIPLEASTGIQLLSILTVRVGAGLDLQFGKSSVGFDITSENEDSLLTSVIEEIITQSFQESEADITMPYSNEGEINIFNPRLMLGLGIGAGPVSFDVTSAWYIRSGFNFGANFVIRI